MKFKPKSAIKNHVWQVTYMVDTVMKRKILHLLETDPVDLSENVE